jgi:hypothetical protein
MNLILMRYGFPIAIISREDRLRYYEALEESQSSDLSYFIGLLAESVHESLEEYEMAAEEHRERMEWAKSLASRFSQPELIRVRNEYEVWKSAMDLLKNHMRQIADLLNSSAGLAHVYFKDFGTLEFEKYLGLRKGESTKRTWFFRVDFRVQERTTRYLFFFGYPSHELRNTCEVTLFVSREDPPGSYYERLKLIRADNVPEMDEIGYDMKDESFRFSLVQGGTKRGKVEKLGRTFFEKVIQHHFSS